MRQLVAAFITFQFEGEATVASLNSNSTRYDHLVEQLEGLGSKISDAMKVLVFSNAMVKRLPHIANIESSTISETTLNDANQPVFLWPPFLKKCVSEIGTRSVEDPAPLGYLGCVGQTLVQEASVAKTYEQMGPNYRFCGHVD
jgi:hypothetical protein